MNKVIKMENVASQVLFVRGEKVLLDFHLAEMYEVETRVLKQQIRRNIDRFPEDFMFELTQKEWKSLRSQIVILNAGRGQHSKYLPFAFTEQGIAMLSSVLRSKKAVEVNIAIMRTFVQLRKMMDTNKELAAEIEKLETKYDEKFQIVFNAIKKLIHQENEPREAIGFKSKKNF
ncbi:MAG: ORF6N domain-containing protein [Cytophagales bacterium]|nr:ORF6N domain-containing protein [Cytophagales bacterium]